MRFPFTRHRRPPASDSVLWRTRFGIGSDRRIELNLHLFFVLTMVTVTWLLALAFFPRFFPGWEPAAYWFVAIAVALIDSLAGLLHELGHAIVALAKGRRISHHPVWPRRRGSALGWTQPSARASGDLRGWAIEPLAHRQPAVYGLECATQ